MPEYQVADWAGLENFKTVEPSNGSESSNLSSSEFF